jgi:hypothetical protein
MKDRKELLKLISELDDEAFSWLVLSFMTGQEIMKYQHQIWPDGCGGFKDSKTIYKLREEAKRWVENE